MRESERGRGFTFSVSVFLSLGAAYWHTVTEIERPLGGLVVPPLREEEKTLVGLPLLNRSFVPSARFLLGLLVRVLLLFLFFYYC